MIEKSILFRLTVGLFISFILALPVFMVFGSTESNDSTSFEDTTQFSSVGPVVYDIELNPPSVSTTTVITGSGNAEDISFVTDKDVAYLLSNLEAPIDISVELTSDFGPRWGRHHSGIDLAAPLGTPILAVQEGVVTRADEFGIYGYTVDIDHGAGLMTRYAHLNSYFISEGDIVERGSAIGELGNTGRSTGPHLHLEIHIDGVPYDPLLYFSHIYGE